MTRRLIDIDDDALAAAALQLGTQTKGETVNGALAEVAARHERLAFLDRMLAAQDDLENVEAMRRAWR